jgi:hypothetical protein
MGVYGWITSWEEAKGKTAIFVLLSFFFFYGWLLLPCNNVNGVLGWEESESLLCSLVYNDALILSSILVARA